MCLPIRGLRQVGRNNNDSTQISCTKFLHKNIARGFHHPPQMEHMGQIFSEQRLLGAIIVVAVYYVYYLLLLSAPIAQRSRLRCSAVLSDRVSAPIGAPCLNLGPCAPAQKKKRCIWCNLWRWFFGLDHPKGVSCGLSANSLHELKTTCNRLKSRGTHFHYAEGQPFFSFLIPRPLTYLPAPLVDTGHPYDGTPETLGGGKKAAKIDFVFDDARQSDASNSPRTVQWLHCMLIHYLQVHVVIALHLAACAINGSAGFFAKTKKKTGRVVTVSSLRISFIMFTVSTRSPTQPRLRKCWEEGPSSLPSGSLAASQSPQVSLALCLYDKKKEERPFALPRLVYIVGLLSHAHTQKYCA